MRCNVLQPVPNALARLQVIVARSICGRGERPVVYTVFFDSVVCDDIFGSVILVLSSSRAPVFECICPDLNSSAAECVVRFGSWGFSDLMRQCNRMVSNTLHPYAFLMVRLASLLNPSTMPEERPGDSNQFSSSGSCCAYRNNTNSAAAAFLLCTCSMSLASCFSVIFNSSINSTNESS